MNRMNYSEAPELYLGKKCNKTVDVYSFGCIILELLSNQTITFPCKQHEFINYMNKTRKVYIPDFLPRSRMNSLLF